MTYLRQFLSWLIDDTQEELEPSENDPSADLERDPQRMTYMYGPGISEWEGTTKWVVRREI